METNRSNNNLPEKACKNACGKVIKWDKFQNAYIEVDSNQRHKCPNWNPNERQLPLNLNRKITQEQQLYVDTIGPAVIEIRSAVIEIRSAVQEIKQVLTQEKEKGVY
jgi:hypothetical protein